jgi:hypothetical protein
VLSIFVCPSDDILVNGQGQGCQVSGQIRDLILKSHDHGVGVGTVQRIKAALTA